MKADVYASKNKEFKDVSVNLNNPRWLTIYNEPCDGDVLRIPWSHVERVYTKKDEKIRGLQDDDEPVEIEEDWE